jgi:hypothetical protein
MFIEDRKSEWCLGLGGYESSNQGHTLYISSTGLVHI